MMDTRSPSLRRVNAAFVLAGAACLIALGVGGTVLYQLHALRQQQQQDWQNMTARLDAIDAQNKQDNTAARFDTIDKRLDAFAQLTDRLTAQNNALQDVAAKVSTLDAAQQQLTSTIGNLTADDHAARMNGWQLALTNLNSKADAAVSFTAELQQLLEVAPPAAKPVLQGLMDAAQNPPPSLIQLRDDLNSNAAQLTQTPTGPLTWRTRLKLYLQNFVSIRPLPNPRADTSTPGGKIAKALSSLDQHDLPHALEATANTPALAVWHDKLAARIDLDDAIAKLAVLDFEAAPPVAPVQTP